MGKMGLRNEKNQMILIFTCRQCNKVQVEDFRYYPICKKCYKTNTKLAKREIEKKKKEENS